MIVETDQSNISFLENIHHMHETTAISILAV